MNPPEGRGCARIAGHLGELIQGRLGPGGRIGLITLPCAGLGLEVSHRAGATTPGDARFTLFQPDGMAMTLPGFLDLHRRLGRTPRGSWTLRSEMPIRAGAGASTAAILAVARILAPGLDMLQMERLCHEIEGASDPLLRPDAERLLWASREGRVISVLPPLPPMQVVGGFQGAGVRTEPEDRNFPDVTDILHAWPDACRSPAAVGALVTESSRRSIALRGGADYRQLENLAASFGAHGFSIAHTGTARAFLLPRRAEPGPLLSRLEGMGWSHLQSFRIGPHK